MSCRWKLDSWFHQLCQYAMSWVPWEHVEGSQSLREQLVNQTSNAICKKRRCAIMWIIKVLTCMPFSDFSSSFAVWSLDFRLSYWRMAAVPKEQPVNWNGVRKQPEALYCPQTTVYHASISSLHSSRKLGRTYPYCEHQRCEKCRPGDSRRRLGHRGASLSGWGVCFLRGIFFLYVWPFGLPTKSTPLLVVGVKTARRKRQLLKQAVVEIYTKKYKINVQFRGRT